MQKQFYLKQFSLLLIHSLVLFNLLVGPGKVQPIRARDEPGAMAIKGYSSFPRAPAFLESHHQII